MPFGNDSRALPINLFFILDECPIPHHFLFELFAAFAQFAHHCADAGFGGPPAVPKGHVVAVHPAHQKGGVGKVKLVGLQAAPGVYGAADNQGGLGVNVQAVQDFPGKLAVLLGVAGKAFGYDGFLRYAVVRQDLLKELRLGGVGRGIEFRPLVRSGEPACFYAEAPVAHNQRRKTGVVGLGARLRKLHRVVARQKQDVAGL